MSDEALRERVRSLEQALVAEREYREEAEATIAGLRSIATAENLDASDEAVCAELRPLFQYQHAAMLRGTEDPPETLRATAADHPSLRDMRWPDGPLRRRVLGGQSVALYDARKSAEFAACVDAPEIRSLLCVPLSIPGRPAVLLGAHERPAFFSSRHLALARRFAQTATRVLESLEAREQDQRRRLAEERAAALARTNEALREQLITIQAQHQQIRRLRAPVLRVGPEVIVVPLIGELDHHALMEVTESVLHAISTHRARRVIVDLTGFESTDPAIAARVESLARTSAMLGASCQLSGLQPAVAQALCDTEVELRAFANLADALGHGAA